MRMERSAAIFTACVLMLSCKDSTAPGSAEVCSGYADWTTSQYLLPYPANTSYKVIQGNCSPAGNGHRGVQRYGYDFGMSIGTQFTAARGGTVAEIEQSHSDGEVASEGLDNYIALKHSDGTVAIYGHITKNGARVSVGQQVEAGTLLGLSGNTGNTNNIPHLHLSVHSCDPVTGGSNGCPSVPITFRNTTANPNGLENGKTYTAH